MNSDLARILISAVIQWWNASRFRGTYRVDAHHVMLDLTDKAGRNAIYTKRQQVTFLQDNVFAIQDQTWGDGDIFAAYRCSPGVAVDRYKEGYRWKILISLRGTRNRGEQEEFVIERTIHDGFTKPIQDFHTQIDHPTQDLSISVVFPQGRHPKQVSIIEQNWKRQRILGKEHQIPLLQGRIQYEWQVHRPRLYEGYILRWEW
ncbi:MAG: hypothetical protein K8L97_17185 [Anaerolineae bacterium]|nr:hypothetical protein [Anaerolineae bacterium]